MSHLRHTSNVLHYMSKPAANQSLSCHDAFSRTRANRYKCHCSGNVLNSAQKEKNCPIKELTLSKGSYKTCYAFSEQKQTAQLIWGKMQYGLALLLLNLKDSNLIIKIYTMRDTQWSMALCSFTRELLIICLCSQQLFCLWEAVRAPCSSVKIKYDSEEDIYIVLNSFKYYYCNFTVINYIYFYQFFINIFFLFYSEILKW